MWPFNKKREIGVKSLIGADRFIDYHSHILPGVDDGLKEPQVSLKALELYEKFGVTEVWMTPHVMEDIPNTTDALLKVFNGLREMYKGPVKLNLAAEYMLDTLFEQRLEDKDLLILGDGHLLIETSYFSPPFSFHEILMRIKEQGYVPVLAHPERYIYMDKEEYGELKKMDIKFQLNISSLKGAYGKSAREKSHWLLNQGYYNFEGTDSHRVESLRKILES